MWTDWVPWLIDLLIGNSQYLIKFTCTIDLFSPSQPFWVLELFRGLAQIRLNFWSMLLIWAAWSKEIKEAIDWLDPTWYWSLLMSNLVQKCVFFRYANPWRGTSHFAYCPDVLDTSLPLWGGSKLHGARDTSQTLCLIQSILVPTESPCQGLSESVFRFEKYRSVPKLQTKMYYCYKTAFCTVSNFLKNFEKIGENFWSDQCVQKSVLLLPECITSVPWAKKFVCNLGKHCWCTCPCITLLSMYFHHVKNILHFLYFRIHEILQ